MVPYALAIFTGAFLLFQIQPLIGKYILPWFGGGPGVWTTCLLFFQVLLLAGYAYAHAIATRWKPRTQAVVHGILLVASLVVLPIAPGGFWKAHVGGNPTWHILLLLAGTIGLPYFVLSSTGPLLQHWFSSERPGVSPYRLYALSNVASLLALLSYPVYFEVRFTRGVQTELWSAGMLVFAWLCGHCAWRIWRNPAIGRDPTPTPATAAEAVPPALDRALWVALPATASVLLLATTNRLCQEVAVIPFLWVLPLALYLLSFVISFDHARWYGRGVFAALSVVGMAVVFELLSVGNPMPLPVQIAAYSATLFVVCMFCHGEVFRLKPSPRHLTAYYLAIAAGGALGGVLVAIVAPAVFSDFHELQLGLWVASYLLGVMSFRHATRAIPFGVAVGALLATVVVPVVRSLAPDGLTLGGEWRMFYGENGWYVLAGTAVLAWFTLDWRTWRPVRSWRPRLGALVMLFNVVVGMLTVVDWLTPRFGDLVSSSRNFYGTLKVFEYNSDNPIERYDLLLHGATTHGLQYTAADKAMWHTTYYGEHSGVGLALRHLQTPPGSRRIGLVGLGTGTLASYGTAGDYLRIYEINPAVVRLARTRFTYLSRCPARVDIVMGDARLSMEHELRAGRPQRFDLLALDAFSGDAIPVHLLTREAFAVYLREINPDGIIAVHISNRYLDLRPVVERLAREFGLETATIDDDDEKRAWIYPTTWVLVTRDGKWLDQPAIAAVAAPSESPPRAPPLWTDDYASLVRILR